MSHYHYLFHAYNLISAESKNAFNYAMYLAATSMIANIGSDIGRRSYYNPNGVASDGEAVLQAFLVWSEAINWAVADDATTITALEKDARQNAVTGTLFALAMLNKSGWSIDGFVKSGDWFSGLAFKPSATSGIGRNVLAVIHGDHCSNKCNDWEYMKNLNKWIEDAMSFANSEKIQTIYGPSGQTMRIIVLVFTNADAVGIFTGSNSVYQTLNTVWGTHQSTLDVPIFIIGIDKKEVPGGFQYSIQVKCIGIKCSDKDVEAIRVKMQKTYEFALQVALRAFPNTDPKSALFLAYSVCTGDVDCIEFFAIQTERWLNGEIGDPPPPEECPIEGCFINPAIPQG